MAAADLFSKNQVFPASLLCFGEFFLFLRYWLLRRLTGLKNPQQLLSLVFLVQRMAIFPPQPFLLMIVETGSVILTLCDSLHDYRQKSKKVASNFIILIKSICYIEIKKHGRLGA